MRSRWLWNGLLATTLMATAACSPGSGNADDGPRRVPPAPPPPGAAKIPFDARLTVDQFGYRPTDIKIAVIRNPQSGFDAGNWPAAPGKRFELRRADDGSAVFQGESRPWNDGAVQPSSGDAGAWFDFSVFDTPGRYFVYDIERQHRSAVFAIDADPYRTPLRAALRTFFYQRSGIAKRVPHAEPCWTDEAAYVGPGQDLEARDVTDPTNPAKARDLSGGWFDAGDTNKYVTFAARAVHRLLSAYQDHPQVFGDDLGIPESGNGVPDILDEVKWEMDWLEKMQNADGSVALKVGVQAYPQRMGGPSSDTLARFYIPACTSSTIAAAGMYAHAALVFSGHEPLREQATRLRQRAAHAFQAFDAAPELQADCDAGDILAGDADLAADAQRAYAVTAAAYLFMLTGESRYEVALEVGLPYAWPYQDVGWSRYESQQGEALLHYARWPGADAELSQRILRQKQADADAGHGIYRDDGEDLYRNFLHADQYHWGSHAVRAAYGTSNLDMLIHGLDEERHAAYRQRALDTLHYFHGVNPLATAYLSNMGALGAERSLDQIYHLWFFDGTRWDDAARDACGPAPGFVPGGPNARAVNDGVPAKLEPPAGQPPQKAYRDWNTSAEAAWTVTEPSITYQAAYIKLVSGLAGRDPQALAQ